MPNNLTNTEIKKALECCSQDICENCPCVENHRCVTMFDALDLIDKLEAENESLKNAYKQCAWERDTFQEELKTASAENERLSRITRNLVGEIKAEAYTEFAERLKEKYPIFENQAYAINPYGFHGFLDNLLKEKIGNDMGRYDPYTDSFVKEEMVGEDNA